MIIKNIKLCFQFFGKNKLKVLALLIIAVSNCIILCSSIGYCNYREYSFSMYDKPEIRNADYVKIYYQLNMQYQLNYENENGGVDAEAVNKSYSEALEDDVYHQIEQLPAVDSVYSYNVEENGDNRYNDSYISLLFSNEDTARLWDYELSDGCWFWETKQTSKYPNAVVCGSIFQNVEVGSDIEILYLSRPYKIHVIGKVAAPYQTVDVTGEYSLGLTNENRIFFLDDEMSYNTFGARIKRNPTGAIVKYKDNSTKEDIEECRKFYKSYVYGKLSKDLVDIDESELDEIDCFTEPEFKFNNTEHFIESAKREAFSRSTFFTVISALMFVILTALMVKVKMPEFCIYRFCGCTRIRSFIIFLSAILSITVLAGILGSLFMLLHTYMAYNGMTDMKMSGYIYGGNCYLTMWLTLIADVLLGSIIPFIVLCKRKITLITLYKTEKE